MLRYPSLATLSLCLIVLAACSRPDNPEEIRRRTANATETVRQDTKAVVDGVKEGMNRDRRAVNINRASREDLLALPGLSEREADRIIAERPYDNTHDLVTRHILREEEYDKIRDRIVAQR